MSNLISELQKPNVRFKIEIQNQIHVNLIFLTSNLNSKFQKSHIQYRVQNQNL